MIDEYNARVQDLGQRHVDAVGTLATHGRSGLSRIALGSVAQKVLRHSAIDDKTQIALSLNRYNSISPVIGE